jgi:hypothetical protein
MSTHGTSGDGPGSGVGGGRSGWASPLGAEVPGAAEVEGVEGDARNAVTTRGVGAGKLRVAMVKVARACAERNLNLTQGLVEARASRRKELLGPCQVPCRGLLKRPRRRSWRRLVAARCSKTSSQRSRDDRLRVKRLTRAGQRRQVQQRGRWRRSRRPRPVRASLQRWPRVVSLAPRR